MVTVDEIRARVEAADNARIQVRADAAAKVAEGAERRAAVARELAELDTAVAADIAAAKKVMTTSELVEFTGLNENDLASIGADSSQGRQSRRRTTTTPRSPRSRRTAAAATSAASSPAG